jgi:hypothetical protein
MEGRGTPARRVAEWLASSDSTFTPSDVIDVGLSSAETLADTITRLRGLALDLDDDTMADVIDGCRIDRDELESLRVVLRLMSSTSSGVTHWLSMIDGNARVQRTLLDHLGTTTRYPERLSAVAEQEPDAWWGIRLRR